MYRYSYCRKRAALPPARHRATAVPVGTKIRAPMIPPMPPWGDPSFANITSAKDVVRVQLQPDVISVNARALRSRRIRSRRGRLRTSLPVVPVISDKSWTGEAWFSSSGSLPSDRVHMRIALRGLRLMPGASLPALKWRVRCAGPAAGLSVSRANRYAWKQRAQTYTDAI
jgi:hypothetical protein